MSIFNIQRPWTYKQYRDTIHFKTIRRMALWMSHNRCTICGSSEDIEVYHANLVYYHEQPEDVVTLCPTCYQSHFLPRPTNPDPPGYEKSKALENCKKIFIKVKE